MDTQLLLKKLQEIRDQLPEGIKQLVVIKSEGESTDDAPIDPKLQKVIDILKALSPEDRDIIFNKCDCLPDGPSK